MPPYSSSPFFPLLLSLFLLLSLGGCSVLQIGQPLHVRAGDWTTEGGGPARTNTTAFDLRPPLDVAWEYDAEGAFGPAAALVADDLLMLVTRKGDIRAVDLEEGRQRGLEDVGEPLEGAPVMTDRVLYTPVAAGKHTIIAHDFVKGSRLWTRRVGPHEAGLLLIDGAPGGDALVAAGMDGVVRNLRPDDGISRWEVVPDSAAGFFAAPVALGPATIAVADDRGRVSALDLGTGETRWTQLLGDPVYATTAAHDGRLFVPTTRGRFVALDAATGDVLWTAMGETTLVKFSAPAVDDGLVIVGASDGRLRALDAATGEPVWTFLADGNFSAAPLIAGGTVYAGSYDEHIYAFDRATGEMIWQYELDGRVKTTPLVNGETLIVLSEPKNVYAFRPASPVAANPEN